MIHVFLLSSLFREEKQAHLTQSSHLIQIAQGMVQEALTQHPA